MPTKLLPGQLADSGIDYVEYQSRGSILVRGPSELAVPAGHLLAKALRVVVCATDEVTPTSPRSNPLIMFGRIAKISGHMGRFKAEAWAGAGRLADLGPFSRNPDSLFDLVLDLNTPPLLDSEIKPYGYYATGFNPQAIDSAVADLVTVTGTFRKPRDLIYDETRCAHAAQGVQGCTRCLMACPAGAITSSGTQIRIDAHLCQGCATCMISCPTGALRPTASSAETFKKLGGVELWLNELAKGTPQVVVQLPADLPNTTRQEMFRQVKLAQAVLSAMGEMPGRIDFPDPNPTLAASKSENCNFHPVDLPLEKNKRDALFEAINRLRSVRSEGGLSTQEPMELPEGMPFGTIEVSNSSCTLCMACVNLCPTKALLSADGGLTLGIVEDRCVQCRICERGCPEQSIFLKPRLLRESEARHKEQVLQEDTPHYCSGCDKPFTGQSLLRRSLGAIQAHGLLSDEGIAQLHYCPSCRTHHSQRNRLTGKQ